MAKKKVNPEEEVVKTAATEETAPQDTPLTEDGMPPGAEPQPAPDGESTAADVTSDAGALPESIELPAESELHPGEIPVPLEMRDAPHEPEPQRLRRPHARRRAHQRVRRGIERVVHKTDISLQRLML